MVNDPLVRCAKKLNQRLSEELKVVLLSEIDVEDSASHFAVCTDKRCWGISNLDTQVSYLVFDRTVKRCHTLKLNLIKALTEVSLHELIHQIMRYDYSRFINNEPKVYALTYILLAYFHLDHVKKRIIDIFKKLDSKYDVGLFFNELAESIIDV